MEGRAAFILVGLSQRKKTGAESPSPSIAHLLGAEK